MALSTHNVLRDYLAVKYGGETEYRLPVTGNRNRDWKIDVLVKNKEAPDRVIEVKGVDVSPSQSHHAFGKLTRYWKQYRKLNPDRQVNPELWWMLPRNPIASGAERLLLAEYTAEPDWEGVTICPIEDRPISFRYELGPMIFTPDDTGKIYGKISDYCRDVEQVWQEFGLIRDEDRVALLALAKATWPLARAVELDQGVWFILNGQANPVTKSWGPLVKQWIAKVHHRWWSVAVLDDSLEG